MRAFVLGAMMVAAVAGYVGAQTMSGVWDAECTIDPLAGTIADFFDFVTNATVTYEIGGWAFTAATQLDDTGWIDQTFSVGGLLGAFSIGMDLDLDPAGAFETWEVTVGTTFGGVVFDLDLTLADLDVTFVVGASSAIGLIDVDATTTFGGDDNDICDFDWSGSDISMEFTFCCAEISTTAGFDCDGFSEIVFGADDIAIPSLPWLSIDAELTFRMETKDLVLSPDFDFDPGLCFDFYVVVETQTASRFLEISDIHVDGIKLVCEFDRTTFTGISFWGTSGKPGALGSYWEMYKLESNDETCCGPLSFETAIFFDETSSNLADVAFFSFELELELGDPLTLSAGLEADVVGAAIEWVFGFRIEF